MCQRVRDRWFPTPFPAARPCPPLPVAHRPGHRNRRIASHEMNKDSSRSHSLLTLYVESETVDEADGRPVPRFGKVVFVDLAGSERLKESQSEGQTKVETGSINKSLFTLGKVIATLSDSGKGKTDTHIPYRDSKLTKLLMDSLGGSSMALMVACISPASFVAAPCAVRHRTLPSHARPSPLQILPGGDDQHAELCHSRQEHSQQARGENGPQGSAHCRPEARPPPRAGGEPAPSAPATGR